MKSVSEVDRRVHMQMTSWLAWSVFYSSMYNFCDMMAGSIRIGIF